MKPTKKQLRTFAGLRAVVSTLRGPEGCPWDKVQTQESLRPYLLEETYEALWALDEGDSAGLCEELGDLLLEVLLHVQIAEEKDEFTMEDVLYSIGDKLVRRHPHVFGDAVAETPEAVVEQWDRLKAGESARTSALDGVPQVLPALAQAQAIQRRASRAGFKFESVEQVWDALEEELLELRKAKTLAEQAEEAGDALFALANLARWYEADAEDCLRNTCRGFDRTYRQMESMAAERDVQIDSMTTAAKLALWEEAKDVVRPERI
jgi:tetrapyrrole methylase family protein/MazG family protein